MSCVYYSCVTKEGSIVEFLFAGKDTFSVKMPGFYLRCLCVADLQSDSASQYRKTLLQGECITPFLVVYVFLFFARPEFADGRKGNIIPMDFSGWSFYF